MTIGDNLDNDEHDEVSDGVCSAAQIAIAEQDSLLRILRDTQL